MNKKILFCGFLFFVSQSASAYVDPGSASLFFQAMIAGLMGGLFLLKVYWAKLRKVLGFSAKKKDLDEFAEHEEEKDHTES